METKKDPMERVKMLPENFDGIVRFTNWSDEDFVGRYNSKDYLFPANTTSPLVNVDISTYDNGQFLQKLASPLELINITKKFALDLAVREWSKSEWYKQNLKRERNPDGTPRLGIGGTQGAASYSYDQLAPLIQKGLYVYPASKAQVSESVKPKLEEKLSRNEEGKTVTKAIKRNASMMELEREFTG
jgi:hypothetical protein